MQYLGGKLREVTLENGVSALSFSSTQYVQAAVKNVEEYLPLKGEKLVAKAPTPLSNRYRPEIDMSLPLSHWSPPMDGGTWMCQHVY